MLCAFVLGAWQTVSAYGNEEFEKDYNFRAYQMGNGKIQMEFLTFSHGTVDHWAHKDFGSKIYYKIHGTEEWLELGSWASEHSNFYHYETTWLGRPYTVYNDAGKASFKMNASATNKKGVKFNHGNYIITNASDGVAQSYVADGQAHTYSMKNDGSKFYRYFIKITWTIDPQSELMGKVIDVKFSTEEDREFMTRDHNNHTIENIDCGSKIASPELYDPVFYPLGTSAACIMVPYSATSTPTSYTTSKNPDVTHPLSDMAGTIYVNAEDTVQTGFYLKMSLRVDSTYNNVVMPSTTVSIPAYHGIYDFKAEPYFTQAANGTKLYKGAKRLSWVVKHPQETDAVPNDSYELQRAYEPDFSDAESLDQIQYKSSIVTDSLYDDSLTFTYEYVDSTAGARINKTHPDRPVYYRVRRTSAYYFGWDGHPYAANDSVDAPLYQAVLMDDYMFLPTGNGPCAEVEKDKDWEHNRKVHLTIPLGNDFSEAKTGKYYQFWDEAAKLKLVRRTSTGIETELLIPNDSIYYVETKSTIEGANSYWEARFTDETSTPCVKYNYSVYVDTTYVEINKMKDKTVKGGYGRQGIIIPAIYDNFYFSNATPISSFTASKGDYEDCTLLTWKQEGGFPDYYKLERKQASESNWTPLATDIVETFYRDSTAAPGTMYDYRLISVVDCYEQNTDTAAVQGYRSAYAQIAGKVMFSNGISQSGVKVTLTRMNDAGSYYANPGATVDKKNTYETVTAADGTFTFKNVAYTSGGSKFIIQPSFTNATFSYGDTSEPEYEFDVNSMKSVVSDITFKNSAYVRVSGRVLFENSTVPVHNACFTINDQIVTSATGAVVKTDASGNFELTVPKSQAITLRAVMDDHKFAGDGVVKIDGDDKITLTKNLDGVKIYDQTKVRLIGRVVGGDTQGDKTLGFGLSKNNLGKNLQFVMQLEGDNISSLVFNPDDLTYKSDSAIFKHLTEGQQTKLKMEQNRIIVQPDTISGEYIVELFPVKYKITQATAQGYATLFNKGMTSQTLDLTNALAEKKFAYNGKEVAYNEKYNIIHHNDANLVVEQYTYGVASKYYGEPQYDYLDVDGHTAKIPTYSIDEDGKVNYVFGYPIFNSGYAYTFRITASEDYYYNNVQMGTPDRVMLANNKVKIYNGLCTTDTISEVTLDGNAQAFLSLPVNNPYFALKGEDAVRTLEMSLALNGDYVHAKAIKAYVTGHRSKGHDFQTEIGSSINVQQVLRDPPGAESYAYIKDGSSWNPHYTLKTECSYGLKLTLIIGSSYDNVVGMYTGSTFSGVTMKGASATEIPIPIVKTDKTNIDWDYTYTTDEEIRTCDNNALIGNEANVFIGTENAVMCNRNESFSAIDDATFTRIQPSIKAGAVREVASGVGADGEKYHLVVAEDISYSPAMKSKFVYSQHHIVTQLIPGLIAERDALLVDGDSVLLQQQEKEGKLTKAVYLNTAEHPDSVGLSGHYKIYGPHMNDEIEKYNKTIMQWIVAVKNAERAVVYGSPDASYLSTYNFDGLSSISHEESSSYTYSYQDLDAKMTSEGLDWFIASSSTSGIVGAAGSYFYENVLNKKTTALAEQFRSFYNNQNKLAQKDIKTISAFTPGTKFDFKLEPVWTYNQTNDNKLESKQSHTTGFVLKELSDNYLSVSVYRVTNNDYNNKADREAWRKIVYEGNSTGNQYVNDSQSLVGDYVYYIRGGATRCPYIGEEKTVFFYPGTVMNKATMQIDRAMMNVDTREVSNVPENGSATFNLKLWNESDTNPNQEFFDEDYVLMYNEYSNPNGLALSVDGQNIRNGIKIRLTRGETLSKTLVAKCGTVYDYNDVELLFMPECDWGLRNYDSASRVKLSAHFTPVAGDVNLSAPRSNWTMNTLSPRDSIGYYIPVVIDGYDTNYSNFNHIELQYKLTDESDDDWVNICSFYANDSLYARASGTKQMLDASTGSVTYPFYGERDPMEQKYDLRAVNFCKHGTSFITKTSSVLSGVKDTRPPKVFGYPEPSDGILGIGDVISIPFSEDIAGQYLDEDANFQVIGYTNSTSVDASTSLQFAGGPDEYAKSEVTRNLNGKDFSVDVMVLPKKTESKMAYFSHGSSSSFVEFGQTSDNRLYATIGNKTVTSKAVENGITAFTRAVMTYNNEVGKVHFYLGGEDITESTSFVAGYKGVGEICLGAGANGSHVYTGRMLEARLWTKELTLPEIAATNKVLTGYERKLLAYYPMNEGRGSKLADKANGASLFTHGQSWNNPDGLALCLDGEDGVQLDETVFTRSRYSDYTLSFWFKSKGAVNDKDSTALFASGRGVKNELSPEGKIFIGFERRGLVVRSNGFVQNISGVYDDDEWHHFVMPVNRTYNTASVFVDGNEVAEFSADSIGGISSNSIYLGACHWTTSSANGEPVAQPKRYAFTGYMDDVTLWETALPKSYLDIMQNAAPTGEELGLLCYLPFGARKTNGNGIYETVFSPYNAKVYYDDKYKKVDKKISLVKTDLSVFESMVKNDATAPITENNGLAKMKFSWMSRENQLVVSLDMLDKEINRNNIFLTVRDVKDMHGNLLADPVMWTVFVDRSQLKWKEKSLQHTTAYDEPSSFEMGVENLCGTQTAYAIDGLPSWLSVNNEQGVILPEEEVTLKFNVSKNLDPGEHSSIIYITDKNGLSEPLNVTVNVVKDSPNWEFDPDAMNTMNVMARVKISDAASGAEYYDTDTEDIVGAFVNGECVGVENITYDNMKSTLYMTLHGSEEMENSTVVFRLWRSSNCQIMGLTPSEKVVFKSQSVAGTSDELLELVTNESGVQSIDLNSGWNWISFNIKPSREGTKFTGSFASEYDFEDNDYIKSHGQYAQFNAATDSWLGSLEQFDHTKAYMVKVANAGTLEVIGTTLNDAHDREINIVHGWNYLPYFNNETMTIQEALSDYYNKGASPKDIVKGYDEFAMLDKDLRWNGSLTHMRPGKGYMLYRNAKESVQIKYSSSASKQEESEDDNSAKRRCLGLYSGNMPVVASVGDNCEGVSLRAISGGEVVGEAAKAADGNFYLMTSALAGSELAFQLVDEAENVLGETAPLLAYDDAASIGSVESPYAVDFNGGGVSAKPSVFDDHVLFQVASKAGDAVSINVFDANGAKCWTHSATATGDLFVCSATDLARLSAGVYVARIKVADRVYNIKLIKKL